MTSRPPVLVSSYEELVLARKTCTRCPGLTNPSYGTLARHDGDEIGPWTRWLGSRPAHLTVIGQDWGTLTDFEKNEGQDPPGAFGTNERLADLLKLVGVSAPPPGTEDRAAGVFLTNAILCLKPGGRSSGMKAAWSSACGSFLRQSIEFSEAKIVICLGAYAFSALKKAYRVRGPAHRVAVAESYALALPTGATGFAVYHPAARAVNRSPEAAEGDWMRLAHRLRELGLTAATPQKDVH